MAVIVVWANPAAAAVDVLRDVLPDRTEPYAAGAVVHAKVPSDRTIATGHPLVMCRPDGSTLARRVDQRALVRVTCWHATEFEAMALAGLVQGILVAHSGDDIRSVELVSGPLPGTDLSTNTPLATCVAAAHMRPSVA